MTSTAGSTARTGGAGRLRPEAGPETGAGVGVGVGVETGVETALEPGNETALEPGPETAPEPLRHPKPQRGVVRRFTTGERMVHRATGILTLLCTASAACLYIGPLAQAVGRRPLMIFVHEWSGILLPVPFLAGLFSPAFRADLRRLNRFAPYDREWLRSVRRRRTGPDDRPAGKFNAGQKLYAGWIAGAVLVMAFTGLLMWMTHWLPGISRTSAIFVHDILAWAIAVVLIGHMRKAFQDPEARLGMRTGFVERKWARREHPHWLAKDEEETKPSRRR